MYGQVVNVTGEVDRAFILILGFAVFVLLGITTAMIYFTVKYNRKKHPVAADIDGSTSLEILWTVIPTIIVLLMFYFGWSSFKSMRTVPENAMEVKVKARMWSWVFEYPNGIVSNQLYVPVNRPVKCNLTSVDVIHSFYVPAFRIKMDCVPGMNTYVWFQGDKTGDYDILCAEYCGLRHAYMLSKVHVMEEKDYNAWLNKELNAAKGNSGKDIYERLSCSDCHTMDGTSDIAPSLDNLLGKERVIIVDGKEKTIKIDREYIKKAIIDPESEVVKGFDAIMPPLEDEMSEEELNKLVNFLEKQDGSDKEDKGIDVEALLEEQGCFGCHSSDGSEIAGPTFKGMFGRETIVLIDGKEKKVKVDKDYFISSLKFPEREIVKGYDPIMPAFEELSDEEIKAIIEYLKTLK